MYGTGFFCVRYGIKLVCTVFWCVRYCSGYKKKISENYHLCKMRKRYTFLLLLFIES